MPSRVGAMAYKLMLPVGSLIHPVFHVSQLKMKLGRQVVPISQLPPVNAVGIIQPEPKEILDCQSRKVHYKAW